MKTLQTPITSEQAKEIRAKYDAFHAWRGNRTSYHPSEIPSHVPTVTNDELSALEVHDFVTNPPDRYFLYINEETGNATTWTGDSLGRAYLGREFRDNFGGKRVPVTIQSINGKTYHGTYFKSAGNYARVKMAKKSAR